MSGAGGRSEELRCKALEALSGDEPTSLIEAATFLSSEKGIAVALLRRLKAETRPTNRQAILYAVSWQGDVRAWWPLLKVLADVEETPAARGQAAEGIAYLFHELGRRRLARRIAIEVLLWALDDPSAEVRYYALFALGSSRDRSVIASLQTMVDDPGRCAAIAGTVGEEARDAVERIQDSTRARD